MSITKGPKSPYYQYDFQLHGRRFFGSTKARNKKDAEAIERIVRVQAKADAEREKVTGNGPLTLDVAAGRFWTEVGQYHAGSADTWRDLERLIGYFGKEKRLDQITDAEVASLVAWRRGQSIKRRKADKDGDPPKLISPATVNRSATGVLKKLFTRAKRTWRHHLPNEPRWKDYWLEEAEERVRELHVHEAEALTAAVRKDYEPWLEFVHLSGLRRKETLLRWSSVNWSTGQIRTLGKGKKWVVTYLTPSVRAVLEPLKGHHPEFVFTFVCRRSRGLQVKGQRYPITVEGAKSEWQRQRKRSGVLDFRLHDFRHDMATKLLRETRNIKLVQKALNHRDIKTTTRYAHVLDDEVANGLETVAESRKKSRTVKSEAA